jgi:hypothetical protein
MKNRLKIIALCGVFACTGAFAFVHTAPHLKGETNHSSTKTLNLAREGDINEAVERAYVLLQALENENWDWTKVDRSYFMLPDQIHHEFPERRGEGTWSFQPLMHADQSELAFTSELYARLNLQVAPGIEGVTGPEGYIIAGWKNGQVTVHPVSEVRVDPEEGYLVFPGMEHYRLTSYRWGTIEP